MEQIPDETRVTVVPLTVQTPSVADVKLTARPELAVALSAKGGDAKSHAAQWSERDRLSSGDDEGLGRGGDTVGVHHNYACRACGRNQVGAHCRSQLLRVHKACRQRYSVPLDGGAGREALAVDG